MHEFETIPTRHVEVDGRCWVNRRPGWVDPVRADERGAPSGARLGDRLERRDGKDGAVTAALFHAARMLIGQSWIMRPSRLIVFPRRFDLNNAIRFLETAETEGQGSCYWAPLVPQSRVVASYGLDLDHVDFVEVPTENGGTEIQVRLNNREVTDRDGTPLAYPDVVTAMCDTTSWRVQEKV